MKNSLRTMIYDMQTLNANIKQHLEGQLAQLNLDITIEMVRVLTILSSFKYTNQQQLANLTNRNKASLTSLIDNMEKRGLVNYPIPALSKKQDD